MKSDNISSLPVAPEDYDVSHYAKVDYSRLHSEMVEIERRFINGLIRWYRPESVLEIGVCEGGGSVNILNAIDDISGAALTSIEVADFCWNFMDKPVGFDVMARFPDLRDGKYNLIVGKDISEVIEVLDAKFEMCVIDSGHSHPVEVLNFLCVLPFLKDGAVVVLQDTSLYFLRDAISGLSPRFLSCATVAEKLVPRSDYYFFNYDRCTNIVAMQITPHTRKYVRNVFETLLLPWECYPQKYIGSVRNLLAKHYSDKNMRSFDKGEEINRAWLESDKKTFSPALLDFAKVRTESIVFYGAGRNMKHFLKKISDFGVRFDFRIWDADHENIREIIGKEVTAPDFETPAEKGAKAVITISNQGVVDLIGPKLENAGYEVFDDIVSMLRHMRDMRR